MYNKKIHLKKLTEEIFEHQIVFKNESYGMIPFIILYDKDLFAYILYSLGGHSIPKEHIDLEDKKKYYFTEQNVFELEKSIKLQGPKDNFHDNLEWYLGMGGYSLYS